MSTTDCARRRIRVLIGVGLASLVTAGGVFSGGGSTSAARGGRVQAATAQAVLVGTVLSASVPMPSAPVTLYRTRADGGGAPVVLGTSETQEDGAFRLSYPPQGRSQAVLYLIVGWSGHSPAGSR